MVARVEVCLGDAMIGQLGLFGSAASVPVAPVPVSAPVPVAPETVTLCRECRWGEEGGRYCAALLASAPAIALPAGDWIMAGSNGPCLSWKRRSRDTLPKPHSAARRTE